MIRQTSHIKYRADIDGLRGLAVTAVIGFHLFPDWIAGGFIGVDIFFVISGFLITSIIIRNLTSDSFSFIDFYSRRIRRIFPALALVLIASAALGWFVLMADEYQQLGKHIVAAVMFASNIILWQEFGYFDTASETKPLLHLWSLGIEEQFYLIWPLLLWVIWKLKNCRTTSKLTRLSLFIVCLGVICFVSNLLYLHKNSIASFYAPHSRFWELLVGAWLANLEFFNERQPKSFRLRYSYVWSLAGAALLIFGTLTINRDRDFPGWWALIPTFGTALVIWAGPEGWFNRIVLNRKPLVWVGLISFPLYLWHWPLMAFARILENGMPRYEIRLAIIILSLTLAVITYRIVERPIRFRTKSKLQIPIICSIMILIGLFGHRVVQHLGVGYRSVAQAGAKILESRDGGGDLGLSLHECGIATEAGKSVFSNCFQDSRGTPRFAVIGDSRASFLYAGLVRTSTENGRWLLIGGVNGTGGVLIPVLTNDRRYSPYQPTLHAAIEAINSNVNIQTVVLASAIRNLFRLDNLYSIDTLPESPNYGIVREGLANIISTFIAAGKTIIIPLENPILVEPTGCILKNVRLAAFFNLFPATSISNCNLELSRHFQLTKKYRKLLSELALQYSGKVQIIDITDTMCDKNLGLCLSIKNNHLMYSFTDHISDYAAGIIGKVINESLVVRPSRNSQSNGND